MSILKLENVSKSYGDTPVLRDIDLEVDEGEFLVLLGFSGTGKTTLINLLAGLDMPTKGKVTFKG
ncbi:MAG: ATP-binding cassette domain-containing protein, partial [Pseudomonadota bacterium]